MESFEDFNTRITILITSIFKSLLVGSLQPVALEQDCKAFVFLVIYKFKKQRKIAAVTYCS